MPAMKILSIDGGGIRGIIPALVLAEIEKRCGRPAAQLFDVIAGTSTGGILACALACPDADGHPRHDAAHLLDLYLEDGPKIFHRSLVKRITSVDGYVDERYDNSALRASLEEHLGEARLKDALCEVFVTAYELRLRQAFFFRSRRAVDADQYDFAMTDVALATSSAPTYFEPVDVVNAAGETYSLIDGGVFATNPAMCAYADYRPAAAHREVVLVSLGTGTQTSAHGIDPEAARGWGKIGWVRPLIDVIFDGVSDTVEYELGQLLDIHYLRLQTPLKHANEALDDASQANLENLRRDADELVSSKAQELDALCERLAAPSS
jgi:patatin-like phospholipase/acyl hydrolase